MSKEEQMMQQMSQQITHLTESVARIDERTINTGEDVSEIKVDVKAFGVALAEHEKENNTSFQVQKDRQDKLERENKSLRKTVRGIIYASAFVAVFYATQIFDGIEKSITAAWRFFFGG